MDGTSFEIAAGESIGFIGPNGAGQSTTMRMVGAVSTRTSDELNIFGLDPNSHGPEIRAQLGAVPQQDNLDTELRVRNNSSSTGAISASAIVMRAGKQTSCWSSRSSATGQNRRSKTSRAA